MPKASFVARLNLSAKQDAHLARYFFSGQREQIRNSLPLRRFFGIGEIYMENKTKKEDRTDSLRFFLCHPTFPIREKHNVRLTLRFQKQSPLPDSS